MARPMILSIGIASVIAGCGLLPTPAGWKVDVANGDRPLIVSIATDRSAELWLVPAGAHLVLLRDTEARQGSIELIDPEDCTLYDEAKLQPTAFTIVIEPGAGDARDFSMRLDPGADVAGPSSTDYTANCSG
jgi:hypothetical protein